MVPAQKTNIHLMSSARWVARPESMPFSRRAAAAARFRHFDGLRVGLEAPVPDSVRKALEAMGHRVVLLTPGNAGGGQAVMKLLKGWAAASDPRKDGMAAGW